jgi:mannitol operon repressor
MCDRSVGKQSGEKEMKYTQEYMALMERECPHLMDHLRYMEVLTEESDRGAVLVTAAMLDDVLTKLLLARLVEGKSSEKLLDGFNAPLGTFSAKIAAARAIGVISEEWRRDLDLLRGIRNDFAHSVTATLGDEPILNKCNELRHCLPKKATDAEGARTRYWMSATAIIFNSLTALHEGSVVRIIRIG